MAGHTADADLAALAETKIEEPEYEKRHPSDEKIAESSPDNNASIDEVHAGLEFPTEEERHTLRRVSDAIPWSAYLIAIIELAERFSYYGCTVIFANFVQQPLPVRSKTGAGGPEGQSGALGRGQQTSFGLLTFFSWWSQVTPLLGAYMADAHWGRFKTISRSLGVVLIGHIILIISAVPGVIEKESAMGAFVVAVIIIGLGTGGFKANISPLVAEQYTRTKLFVITTKSGERVIADPALTVGKIYMYFYLFINIGSLVGPVSMAYTEKYVGFWLAYTLPTIILLLCPLALYFGRNHYIHSPPTGSVFAAALRLWRFAARGRWRWNPVEMIRLMNADDFWENVKPSHLTEKPRWMTFDDQWVDEVRRGYKACGVFLWFVIYYLTYNQLAGNLTAQAATMTTHNVPNDVLTNLDPFAIMIFIPLCDLLIYPALGRMGINFSALKKITWGFFTGAAAMVWAAVVQHYIYKTSPCGDRAATCIDEAGVPLVSPLNVWIQTGSYVLLALSEIFAVITGLQYAYLKAPKNMRSLVMAIFLFISSIAAALNEAFTTISLDPYLIWNYGSMGVIAAVGGTLFWISVRKLDADEDRLNNLAEGHLDEKK